MSGQGNEPVDEDDFDLVNPVFENANSAGSSNGGGTARARGSGVAGVLAGVENGRQRQNNNNNNMLSSPNNKSSRGRDVQESPPKESLRRQVLLSMIT
eukprot:scaffold20932_cov83-Skeletonema_menzelii.AAC.2